jgi:hypothetical protein
MEDGARGLAERTQTVPLGHGLDRDSGDVEARDNQPFAELADRYREPS